MPNGIRIRFAVFPQCTGQTDIPTDRSRESLTTTGRYSPKATQPNNIELLFTAFNVLDAEVQY